MTRFKNQTTILDNSKQPKIVIVGAGGVGSMVALCLAKMGLINVSVIDFDEVEDHNVASQFYWTHNLNQLKVDALTENVKMFTDVELTPINGKRDGQYGDITIVAVDNMDVRKEVVKHIHEQSDEFTSSFVIECRMWGTEFIMYNFDAYTDYKGRLGNRFSEAEKDPEICTEKAIAFNTFIIAGLVGSTVRDYIMEKEIKPFITNQF